MDKNLSRNAIICSAGPLFHGEIPKFNTTCDHDLCFYSFHKSAINSAVNFFTLLQFSSVVILLLRFYDPCEFFSASNLQKILWPFKTLSVFAFAIIENLHKVTFKEPAIKVST
jgi:hypothetical protein